MSDNDQTMSFINSTDGEGGPPLNSIRVFVETAGRLSFSRAGEALGMTQSGVSHHIGVLENYLGQRLFVRAGASVELSDAGRLYYDAVRESFSTIDLATRQLRLRPRDSRLIVRASLPSFAQAVLIPALPRFAAEPAVAVDLLTSLSPPAAGEAFDVLISRDLSLDDDSHWLLTRERLVCVAAPALHGRYRTQAIGDWPFIVARSRPDTLAAWCAAQSLAASAIHLNASFEHYFLAIAAAVGGLGYLVVPHILVGEALRLGQLVDAGFAAVRGEGSYRTWVNPRSDKAQTARAFCRWLKAEVKAREASSGV